MKRINFLWFFAFVLAFQLISAASAATCPDGQRILRLSSAINAHGEIYNGASNYPEEICYNAIFGRDYSGANPHACSASNANKVIGLSSSTNAHGEITTESNYNTIVCYGDLICRAANGQDCISDPDPSKNEKLVISLLTQTNSHINSYSVSTNGFKICCKSPSSPPPSCNFNGIKDGTEQCDGADIGAATCSSGTEKPTCSSCVLSYSSCTTTTPGAKQITEAKWADSSGSQITKASKQARINLVGKANGYATTDQFSMSIFKKGTLGTIAPNKYTQSPDSNGNIKQADVTMEEVVGTNAGSGDIISFDLVSKQDGREKRSNELEILPCDSSKENCESRTVTIETDFCGRLEKKGDCNTASPTESLGSTTCVLNQNLISKCEWNDVDVKPGEKKCTQRDTCYDNNQIAGTCDYTYSLPDDVKCADGKKQLKVTIVKQGGSATCNALPKSIPCGGVNVAALPFFGTLQLVIALIAIGLVYWVITSNRKRKGKDIN